jgi:hypothetical protein
MTRGAKSALFCWANPHYLRNLVNLDENISEKPLPSCLKMTHPIRKKYSSPDLLHVALAALIFVAIVSITVPFAPAMPELLNGEIFATNQAVAQGLVFGRDYIFTYGPYASIYTMGYHPATDALMVKGALLLGLGFCVSLQILFHDASRRWLFAYLFVLVSAVQNTNGALQNRDALLLAYPFLAALAILKICNDPLAHSLPRPCISIVSITAALGLLPLIKGSMLVFCCYVLIICIGCFILANQKLNALMVLTTPLFFLIVFWIGAGQPVFYLPSYFFSMIEIIGGYSEAMAKTGDLTEICAYLLAALLMLVDIKKLQIGNIQKWFLLLLFGGYFFIVLKASFVRHDEHATIAAVSLLFAGTAIPFVVRDAKLIASIFVCFLAWAYIDSHYSRILPEQIVENVKRTYVSSLATLFDRFQYPTRLAHNYQTALAKLNEESHFPKLTGTSDIYSFDQPYLIATGNAWNPRPVFQSYSNYTQYLSAFNEAHISGKQGSDNIVFKPQPIDGRHPALEDGSSWPIFIENYYPFFFDRGYIFLKKRAANTMPRSLQSFYSIHSFGEEIQVPETNGYVFASMEIEATVLGKVAGTLFKPTELRMVSRLKNGTEKDFSIISGMTKPGFIISPLVENAADFLLLQCGMLQEDSKRVKSFLIFPVSGEFLWKTSFALRFEILMPPALPLKASQYCSK